MKKVEVIESKISIYKEMNGTLLSHWENFPQLGSLLT
jgi:hypothetical protein